MTRARKVDQKGLSDENKCEDGICKSDERRWTQFCGKHKAALDKTHARWHYTHVTGIDLDVNEEVPK